MNAVPSVAVVVPFFNEERNVEAVCLELREVLTNEGYDAEIVLVDDGSTDATSALLDRLATNWPAAQIYHRQTNKGQSAALLLGFSKTTAPVLVTMDGDGQNDPHDIPKLLRRLVAADMVVGARVERQDSWMRRKISQVANHLRADWLGDGVSDSGCALKVFRREVMSAFIPIRTLYSFMPALAVAAGFRVVEESVHHRPRQHGTSKYSVVSFLFLPIVDFIGLKWFRSRRCQEPSSRHPGKDAGSDTLGTDLYWRASRRWIRRASLALALVMIALLFLWPRETAVGPTARKISLDRAEGIALGRVPKGQLGSEELLAKKGRLTWTIDVQPVGSTGWNEIDVDALSGQVIASSFETAAEEEFETAVEDNRFDPKKLGPH